MAIPLCLYFKKCGGCSFQDVGYPQQLEDKKKRFAETINFDDIRVFSGKEYFYRHRMDMVFHSEGLGFREKGFWHRIVDIEKCVISNESLNSLICEIREFFKDVEYFDVKKTTGTFRYAVMRTPPDDSSVSIVLNKNSEKLKDAHEKIAEFAKMTKARNVLVTYVPHNRDVSVSDDFSVVKGSEMLREDLCGKVFWF